MGRIYLADYQQNTLRCIRQNDYRWGVFLAPGTGKTIVAIRAAKFPVLVICRRDDFLTWQLELQGEGFPSTFILSIRKGTKIPEYDPNHELEWVMVTYDLMKNPDVQHFLYKFTFEMVIADEVHMIKTWKSKRTQACITHTRHIPHRLGLTGSAITNDPIDLFSICYFLDDGQLFGTNEWKFKKRYYIKSGLGWYKKRTAPEEISKKVQKISTYVHEDDVLTLPPIRNIIKAVPMTSQQFKAYEQIVEDWEYTISTGETIEIDYVIVQLQKLKQIASGFMYGPPPERPIQTYNCEKTQLLKSLLEEDLKHKSKIVIWGSYRPEIENIADHLKHPYVLFTGKQSARQREQARVDFKNVPEIRYFIGQVDMGIGINELVVADTAIYHSNSLRVLSRQQSLRRIRRRGSEHHKAITYYDLVTEGTIDLPLVKSVKAAMSLAHNILSGIRDGKPLRKLIS